MGCYFVGQEAPHLVYPYRHLKGLDEKIRQVVSMNVDARSRGMWFADGGPSHVAASMENSKIDVLRIFV